jgi:hypothetical protein
MVRCINGVAKLLNVDRSNMKKAMERHLQLDTKKNIIWIGQRQQKGMINQRPYHSMVDNSYYDIPY